MRRNAAADHGDRALLWKALKYGAREFILLLLFAVAPVLIGVVVLCFVFKFSWQTSFMISGVAVGCVYGCLYIIEWHNEKKKDQGHEEKEVERTS